LTSSSASSGGGAERLAVVVVDVSLGAQHSLALSDVGLVYSFGSDEFGQLGLGAELDAVTRATNVLEPTVASSQLSTFAFQQQQQRFAVRGLHQALVQGDDGGGGGGAGGAGRFDAAALAAGATGAGNGAGGGGGVLSGPHGPLKGGQLPQVVRGPAAASLAWP
jgi:hypothetical protein